jgi:hypothetical protein
MLTFDFPICIGLAPPPNPAPPPAPPPFLVNRAYNPNSIKAGIILAAIDPNY